MEQLEKVEISVYLKNILHIYMTSRKIVLERNSEEDIFGGVPQGLVFGPILWDVLYDDVMRLPMLSELDRRLNMTRHIKEACRKAEKSIKSLKCLLPNIGGPSSTKRRVLAIVCQSIVLYGAAAWSSTAFLKINKTRLNTTQRNIAPRVCSAYYTVSGRNQVEVQREPLKHGMKNEKLVRKIGQKQIYRMFALGLKGNGTHRIKKRDHEKCICCDAPVDEPEHTIFECPQWSGERRTLYLEIREIRSVAIERNEEQTPKSNRNGAAGIPRNERIENEAVREMMGITHTITDDMKNEQLNIYVWLYTKNVRTPNPEASDELAVKRAKTTRKTGKELDRRYRPGT
ncbi:hypothetical protein HUJ05_007727 [Dendroctonus ponderosae]|nr:hypothetical protein HUJ05_007727 [Dendroctonus ponderosae]